MIGIGGVGRTGAVAAAVLVLATVLGGCGKIATNDSVEQQIKGQLGTDSADCPNDLKGEVGQSIVCTAKRGDDSFDVKVTVTSVDGDTINFDIQRVAPPASAPAAPATDTTSATPAATVDGKNVAQSVFDQLASNGKQVNQVSCPDLEARVGASERCTLVSGTETYGVTVTVTTVQGADVKFDIQVDQTPQ
jgi:Domain of unknown function (DUF4333)